MTLFCETNFSSAKNKLIKLLQKKVEKRRLTSHWKRSCTKDLNTSLGLHTPREIRNLLLQRQQLKAAIQKAVARKNLSTNLIENLKSQLRTLPKNQDVNW